MPESKERRERNYGNKWLKLDFKVKGQRDDIDEIVDMVIHKYTEQKVDLLYFNVEGGDYNGK